MKTRLASLLVTTLLATAPLAAHAYTGSNPAAGGGKVEQTQQSYSSALQLLKTMNKGGYYARDFYRNTFMQVMGLVFFDPNTPDITSCEKDVLNYHLPELTRNNLDYSMLQDDLSRIMAEIYTTDELAWLDKFYRSPFGERMLKKQVQYNERVVRELANKYARLQPEFKKVYTITAERCGGKAPATKLDTSGPAARDILSVPATAPLPASPQPVQP